jgi:membrane associated rhomboid family serine protease
VVRQIPWATIVIAVICVAVELWQLGEPGVAVSAAGYRPAIDGPVRMLTSAFVHGGWFHLFGNMLFLYLVGCNLEDRWTRGGFVAFYLVAAIVAAATYGVFHPGSEVPLVGASGAVAAAMGAFLVVLGGAQIRFAYLVWFLAFVRVGEFHARAYVVLPLWFLMQALSALLEYGSSDGGGVAYSAHVGGFVFGVAVGGVMRFSGLDRKLDERDDEVVFDAQRGVVTLPVDLVQQLRTDAATPMLVAAADRFLQEAGREGRVREVVAAYAVIAKRDDMRLSDRALLVASQAAGDVGDAELAIMAVRDLMTHHPGSTLIPRALWDTAEVQRKAGRTDLAERTLDHLRTRYPDDPFAKQAARRS